MSSDCKSDREVKVNSGIVDRTDQISFDEYKSAMLLSSVTHFNPEPNNFRGALLALEFVGLTTSDGVQIADYSYVTFDTLLTERAKWKRFIKSTWDAPYIRSLHLTYGPYNSLRKYHEEYDGKNKVMHLLTDKLNHVCDNIFRGLMWFSKFISDRKSSMEVMSYLVTRKREHVIALIRIALTAIAVPRVIFLQSADVADYLLDNILAHSFISTCFFSSFGFDYGLLYSVGCLFAETGLFSNKGLLKRLKMVYGSFSILSMDNKHMKGDNDTTVNYNMWADLMMENRDYLAVLVKYIKTRLTDMHIEEAEVPPIDVNYRRLATTYVGDSYVVSPCPLSLPGRPSDMIFKLVRDRRLIVDNIGRAILNIEPVVSDICERTANEINEMTTYLEYEMQYKGNEDSMG